MKNSLKAVIYPINKEYVEILKYKEIVKKYEEIIPVCLSGQGIEHRDAGELVKGKLLGIEIMADFEICMQDADDIIFTEFSDVVFDKMMYSIEHKKNIVCLFELEDEMNRTITGKCIENGVHFKNYCDSYAAYDMLKEKLKEKKIKEMNVPILLICGLSEYTNKFEVQLRVREEFKKRGYCVSQIGSKKYSRIFEMHNFPKFMFQNIPEIDKIYLFNSYVKQIEIKEHPDIIIIGVPGGIMPYDMDHPNGFGIVNYLVSNALSVDSTLLCLAYNEYEDSFWEFIADYMQYRYEYSVQSFHLANVFHDIYGDERNEGERLVYMKQKKVDEKIESFDGKKVFNINNEETFRKEMDELIDYLTN